MGGYLNLDAAFVKKVNIIRTAKITCEIKDTLWKTKQT
jgi:hypothetical protein